MNYEFGDDTSVQSIANRFFWLSLPIPHPIHSLLSPFLAHCLEKDLNQRQGRPMSFPSEHFLINPLVRYAEGNQTDKFLFKILFSKRHILATLLVL